MNIYITSRKDNIKKEQRDILESLGNVIYLEKIFELDSAPYLNDEEEKVLALDPDFYDWNLQNAHIDKVKNLKGICLQTTSYSWIDVDYCKSKGIVVTNIPKYSTTAVSEYAIFLMMSLARKLPLQIKNNFKCEYNSEMLMESLEDKTIGIIGLGSIGNAIAEKCKGIGMNVMYWSRNSKNDNFSYVEIEELFKEVDYIFPTLLSNDETKKIITDELINSMKETSSFISIVHGDLYNHNLILEKVKKGEISGYAFEENEKDMRDYVGNVMVTSCYAWYTKEALENLVEIWIDSIKGITNGNVVNGVNI